MSMLMSEHERSVASSVGGSVVLGFRELLKWFSILSELSVAVISLVWA